MNDDLYKEIDDVENKRVKFNSLNFNEIYQFSLHENLTKERFTPNQNEVSDCLQNLTEEPPIAFFAASKLVEFVYNAPDILQAMNEEQLMPIFSMLQDIAFQRVGLSLLSMAFEACDLLPSFQCIIENDIFGLLKAILQQTDELEIFWNILTCIKCASKSSIFDVQNALVMSEIINTIISDAHEEEEFQIRKFKTICALLQANWIVEGFDIFQLLFDFCQSLFLDENELFSFYGVKMMNICCHQSKNSLLSFLSIHENHDKLLFFLQHENNEIRENAISLLSVLSNQNNENIESFFDISIINQVFQLIHASTEEKLGEKFKILLNIFNIVNDQLKNVIVQNLCHYFEADNLMGLKTDAKIVLLKIIDEISDAADVQLLSIFISSHIKDFIESLINTENIEYVSISCHIFVNLYQKLAAVSDEIPEHQLLSSESLDIIQSLVDDANDEDDVSSLNELLQYYSKNEE